jgi:hypothetical protein
MSSLFDLIKDQINQLNESTATAPQVDVSHSFMFGALKQCDLSANELAQFDGQPLREVVEFAATKLGSNIIESISDNRYNLMFNGISVALNSLFKVAQTGLYRITYPAGTAG